MGSSLLNTAKQRIIMLNEVNLLDGFAVWLST
jgi:hypothetical protein